jgi:hydroxymethylpyrimidine/phosphomethylpyrimidine kinase
VNKVLTIAGSDSSGGAGIQADLKTFLAHGVYGMSVITAITAQNTTGVFGVENLSKEIVKKQLDAVFMDIVPDAVKIGMVSNKELIQVIADTLTIYQARNVVLDTVMISTSGHSLLEQEAKNIMIHKLLPMSSIITPNIPEAQALTGISIKSKEDMRKAAKILSQMTDAYILIKGGHLLDCSDDLLYGKAIETWYLQERIPSINTHGTGCTLSSAIASNLALGQDIEGSVENAKKYITGAILDGINLGKGNGPINHGWRLSYHNKSERNKKD